MTEKDMKTQIRVLLIYGTRPEAIKLAPLIIKMKEKNIFKINICLTAQHRKLVDQVNKYFDIKPDFDLNLMTKNQSLETITSKILISVTKVIKTTKPDLVIVHGDTTTTFASALSAFYNNIPVAHVEAGLRTHNKNSPFPEEFNRFSTSYISKWHFAPTIESKKNLLDERVPNKNILVTGNTIVDSVKLCVDKIKTNQFLLKKIEKNLINLFPEFSSQKRYILITCHRRENFGSNFKKILQIIRKLCITFGNVNFVFPKHLNPNTQPDELNKDLHINNLYIINPLPYQEFLWLLYNSYLILTDSGGIQEEGASLKKPILIMRESSERPEVIDAGFGKLVGTNKTKIMSNISKLINNTTYYSKFVNNQNPFGDGKSSEKIIKFIEKKYGY